jgi:hypothetical protein
VLFEKNRLLKLIFTAMKRMFFAALLLVAFSNASFTKELVAEGRTFSALGDYKIEVADDPVTINGKEFKAFVISYQNTPLEVKVAVRNDQKGKKYIVLSDKLCVQYVCNETYFGVERLDKSFAKDGYTTSDAALNRNEYFHQKVLTSGQGCELDNTRLIAAYFPKLINSTGETVSAR